MVAPLLLLCIAARAGAPDGFVAGVEGQTGYGPAVVSPDGDWVALTRWDRAGLWVWQPSTGALQQVSAARGAGFHPIWEGDALWTKAVVGTDQPEQQVLRWEAGTTTVVDRAGRVGQPELTPDGVVWAHGDTLVRRERAATRTLWTVGDVDLVAASPTGALAWDDAHGVLQVREPDGAARTLSAAGRGAHPDWSDDGGLLLHTAAQQIVVVDPATGARRAVVEGSHPQWIPGTRAIVFERIETGGAGDPSPYVVRASSLWRLDVDAGRLTRIYADPGVHPRYPTPTPDGGLYFVDTLTGDLWTLHDGVAAHALAARASKAPPPPDVTSTTVSVPYMHQLWDTPDDFNGSWSCGPTSCVQTLSTWSTLPNADITCSWPSAHTSHWGWYIPNSYSFNGYTYDAWGVAAGGDCQGAHGYICREYGGAVWAYMTAFMIQHGVDSAQVGTDYNSVLSEVGAGYPMYASVQVLGYGHILVVRGYLSVDGSAIHTIVVNDPYGNAGTGDWGNNDGEGIGYDWPGYNNGYLEIEVAQLFTAHGTAPPAESEPEPDPVDTGTPAPVDTGPAATTDPVDSVADPGDPFEPEAVDEPGDLALNSGLGCSAAPGAPARLGLLLALVGLGARRRQAIRSRRSGRQR